MDPVKLMRSLLVGTATLLAIVVMFWLQSKFDGADRANAVKVVRDYHARGGWSVPDILEQKHPGRTPVWTVETQSSCFQTQRVSADVDGVRYQFVVAINGPSIHPGNPASEAVMKQLDDVRPGGAPATSATAPIPAAPAATVEP
jgi:hypothetical protein